MDCFWRADNYSFPLNRRFPYAGIEVQFKNENRGLSAFREGKVGNLLRRMI